jgi:hypothetical protein
MSKNAGYKGSVLLCGAAVSMTNEALSSITADVWRVTASAKNVFDPETAVSVEVSEDSGSTWTELGTEEYTVNFLFGIVDIDAYTSESGNTANIDQVRIDGAYLPKYTLANARASDWSANADLKDASVFQDEGMRRKRNRLDFEATVESLAQGQVPLDGSGGSEDAILDLILGATRTVYEFTPTGDESDFAIRAFVKLASQGVSVPGDDLVQANISMSGALPGSATANQTPSIFNYR